MKSKNKKKIAEIEKIKQEKLRKKVMFKGVTLLAPETIFLSKSIKLESGATGPVTLIFDLIKFFIALFMISFSSNFFNDEKLCGFNPRIAKFGFLLKILL